MDGWLAGWMDGSNVHVHTCTRQGWLDGWTDVITFQFDNKHILDACLYSNHSNQFICRKLGEHTAVSAASLPCSLQCIVRDWRRSEALISPEPVIYLNI